MKYDLEERTARFGEEVIATVKKVKVTPVNKRIIEQLVGAAGSIGANYCEANESESKKDFVHKVRIAIKETKESKHWIRLLASAEVEIKEKLRSLWRENQEILMIFSKILVNCKTKKSPVLKLEN